MSYTEIELSIWVSESSSARDTGHRVSFLPLKVQDERRSKQSRSGKRRNKHRDKRRAKQANAAPKATKRRSKEGQTGKRRDKRRDIRRDKRRDKRSQTQHTTHTNTNIIYFFSLEFGVDWDGVKPGLGWLNGITHDIFLDYFF